LLDSEACYRAVRSRDRRFDGRFFTAVASTGIYCRPICPVRPPKRENMRFYSSAAAAEGAGIDPVCAAGRSAPPASRPSMRRAGSWAPSPASRSMPWRNAG